MLTHNEELTLELLESIENPNPEQLELIKELKTKQSNPESENENCNRPEYVIDGFLKSLGITDASEQYKHFLASSLLAHEYTVSRLELGGIPKELYEFINPLMFTEQHPLTNLLDQLKSSNLPDLEIPATKIDELLDKHSKIVTMMGEYAMTGILEAICRSSNIMTVLRLIDGVMIESSIQLAYQIHLKDSETFPISRDIIVFATQLTASYFKEKMGLILQNLALLNLKTDFDDLCLRKSNPQLERVQSIIAEVGGIPDEKLLKHITH